MSARTRVAKALSVVLPGGALGASIVLALTAAQANAAPETDAASHAGVAQRLQAIRAGVSELSSQQQGSGSAQPETSDAARLTPTWWGNGGWGRWHMGWGNGGWGGWPNWHNGWHNWGNGWHNWGNGGWHNFWHNW